MYCPFYFHIVIYFLVTLTNTNSPLYMYTLRHYLHSITLNSSIFQALSYRAPYILCFLNCGLGYLSFSTNSPKQQFNSLISLSNSLSILFNYLINFHNHTPSLHIMQYFSIFIHFYSFIFYFMHKNTHFNT